MKKKKQTIPKIDSIKIESTRNCEYVYVTVNTKPYNKLFSGTYKISYEQFKKYCERK